MTHEPWFEDGRTGTLAVAELQRAAHGMLVARRAMRGVMPEPLLSDLALEVMLALFTAHPTAKRVRDLVPDTSVSPALIERWNKVMEGERLVTIAGELLALTSYGVDQMTEMLSRVVRSQRELYGWKQ